MAPIDTIAQFGRRTFASLAIRNYRLYFTGQVVSFAGTWMQTVALGWLALSLSNSGTQLGLVVSLQFLPLLLLGAWSGVVVDRMKKRRILIMTQSAFAILALCLSLLVFTGTIQLWMLYLFALGIGFVRLFDDPTRQSFVSEMVDQRYVKNAVSLNATANNLARAIGPSIGGVLIAGIGIAFCFLANGLTYLVVIVMLLQMKERELHTKPPTPKRAGQILEGFSYVRGNPLIRDTLIVMAIIGTFAYEFQVTLPILAKGTFGSDAAGYAALLAAMGIGSVVGGLFSAGRSRIAPHHVLIYGTGFGLSILAAAFMPSLDLAIAAMLAVGFFSINVTSVANTMVQLESTPEMRGRVMALWSIAMIGSTPIGGPIVGFLGEHLSPRAGLASGGIATLLAVAPAAGALLKRDIMRFIPDAVWEREDEAEAENIKL